LEEFFVVLLCVVPFIENRGAIFVGFALGVTDPMLYVMGSLLNISLIPLYFNIFKKVNLNIINLRMLNFSGTEFAFTPLLVLPANGMNSLTTSFITSRLGLDYKKAFVAISAGIVARGALTYALCVGTLALSEYWRVADVFWLLLLLFGLVFVARNIGGMLWKKRP